MARIEPSGERACCAACGTTPGTRGWHAKLQRFCAAHVRADCPALACPQGPTRAVCRSGRCEATATAADGGVAYVEVEQRCLPAVVCDDWAGCAGAIGNDQDGWFVDESARVARGAIAGRERVATADARAVEVLRLFPPGAQCPPHAVPPVFSVPSFACAAEAGKCSTVGR